MVMSMGGLGMSSMGMGGMNGMNSSGNVYQATKAKYGCGHADFGERPTVAPYPMEIIPKPQDTPIKKSWFGRLMDKLYG